MLKQAKSEVKVSYSRHTKLIIKGKTIGNGTAGGISMTGMSTPSVPAQALARGGEVGAGLENASVVAAKGG